MRRTLTRLDAAVTTWLARNGLHVLRIGLAVVYLWFGALKLVPGLSPAEGLIERTVGWIVDPVWFLPLLAVWECAIGLGLMFRRLLGPTVLLLAAHMAGTFMPLVACPEEVWTEFPYAWTLEGQYILKNLVLVGAALVLAGSLRCQQELDAGSTSAARPTSPQTTSRPVRCGPRVPPIKEQAVARVDVERSRPRGGRGP